MNHIFLIFSPPCGLTRLHGECIISLDGYGRDYRVSGSTNNLWLPNLLPTCPSPTSREACTLTKTRPQGYSKTIYPFCKLLNASRFSCKVPKTPTAQLCPLDLKEDRGTHFCLYPHRSQFLPIGAERVRTTLPRSLCG